MKLSLTLSISSNREIKINNFCSYIQEIGWSILLGALNYYLIFFSFRLKLEFKGSSE